MNLYGLNKKHLSYSAIDLWNKNPQGYRDRYYLEEPKKLETPYTLYGREVHVLIDKDPKYASIRLPVAEKEMRVEIDGISVLAYIDTYCPDTHAFGEYKSGKRKKDGSPCWNKVDVQRHEQLPFYSLLIQEKFGKKINSTYLVWLETKFYEHKRTVGTVVLANDSGLRLTGHMEVFKRKMYQYDRDRVRDWIITSAAEIIKDYKQWTKNS